MIALALLMSTADAKPPPRPEHVAELSVVTPEHTRQVTLTTAKAWNGRAIGEDGHLDPLTTALEPRLERGDGRVVWLVGYALSKHERPGDTRVTYGLVLELPPTGNAVKALWWEDHQEVPTSLYAGTGTLIPGRDGGASALVVDVKHTEYGDEVHLEGIVAGL